MNSKAELNDLWKYSGGQWTWVSGSSTYGASGIYGTKGTAASGNTPGARYGAMKWKDASNNIWLFGGYGRDASGTAGFLNDLWKYSGGQWAWMGGSNTVNSTGSYGTSGVAADTNLPPARAYSTGWTDAAGDYWLFGGFGGTSVYLNDIWKYSAGKWTWMGGANASNANGTYGTKGTASASNIPGARNGATAWRDASGNTWLFGGYGRDSSGHVGYLNDLWKYSGNQWTWVGGENTYNYNGTFGTQGTAAAGNTPGSLAFASGWVDATGNFWLFGGMGFNSSSIVSGDLNDLWKFSNGQWTWVSGSNSTNSSGTYGIQGTAGSANIPSGRDGAAMWRNETTGSIWFFGGQGMGMGSGSFLFNDLWKYTP